MAPPSSKLSLLLVAPFVNNVLNSATCFFDNFYGTYRDAGSQFSVVTVSDATCLNAWNTQLDATHYSPAPLADRQLVWLEKVEVDKSLLRSQTGLDEFWLALQAPRMPFHPPEQEILTTDPASSSYDYHIHYRTKTAALISLDASRAKAIDIMLPPFWRSMLLPKMPVEHVPVQSHSLEVVRNVLAQVKFNPVAASIINNISIPQLKNDICFLTGEDKSSGIVSRHSFSIGALTAAHWLKERVEDTGATCHLMSFMIGFAPNIICRYAGTKDTNATVLISAHYDSRGSFGSIRAPGANDDGSGAAGLLAIARTIGRKEVKFHSNVELAFFAGEEQGLLGSKAYASELHKAGANITLMIQADMIAYRAPGEPLQIGLPQHIGTPEATQLVANISSIYSPELTVGYTPVCCSDHQSFFEKGFPATHLFERAGPIADPMYHNSDDLSEREGYDFDQLFGIAKVQFATLLHAADFEQ